MSYATKMFCVFKSWVLVNVFKFAEKRIQQQKLLNAKRTLLHYIDYIIMVSFNINKKDLLFHQAACYIINPSKK